MNIYLAHLQQSKNMLATSTRMSLLDLNVFLLLFVFSFCYILRLERLLAACLSALPFSIFYSENFSFPSPYQMHLHFAVPLFGCYHYQQFVIIQCIFYDIFFFCFCSLAVFLPLLPPRSAVVSCFLVLIFRTTSGKTSESSVAYFMQCQQLAV